MTMPVDDLSSRTGGVPSLVLTIVGLYLRRVGGWMSTAQIIRLAQQVEASEPLVRSAITRLKQRGVLVGEARGRTTGYALNPDAERMFERGDRRIFAPRHMSVGEMWCAVAFSVPETQRAVRHQLRKRLMSIGCGQITPGLWICPDFLSDEVDEILGELDIRNHATLLRTLTPRTSDPISTAVARWWDLDSLADRHRQFIAAAEALGPFERIETEAEAFRAYVRAIDAWRDLPYLDPGLPFEYLPDDWPGVRSIDLYTSISTCLSERAWAYVQSVMSRDGLPSPL